MAGYCHSYGYSVCRNVPWPRKNTWIISKAHLTVAWLAYAIPTFHTLNSNAVFHTVTIYPCGNAWEGPPVTTWLSAGMRAGGMHLHPLVLFLTVRGGTEGQEHGTPAAEQLRGHEVPCRRASAAPAGWILTGLSSPTFGSLSWVLSFQF